MSERPETPEGEQHSEESTPVVEPVTASEPISAPPAALAPPPAPPPPVVPPSPAAAAMDSDRPETAADRPEIQIGAAFAGGFLIALILKRLAR